VVGPSGLLIAIIGYWSFAVSVLVWTWGKRKEKKLILVLGNIVFHCQLRAPMERAALRMILVTTEGVFAFQVISVHFE
jgi:hypothetical protein